MPMKGYPARGPKPVSAQKAEHLDGDETKSEREQSVSTTLGAGDLFVAPEEESAAA